MTHTHMRSEIEEIPAAVARLLESEGPRLAEAGTALRQADPAMVATIARGSSDHAAAFFKYACELVAGIPVASIGPSVASVYGRELRLGRSVALAISQSGRSPDIVALASSARRAGALTIALTNTPGSPLIDAATLAVDLAAGKERSVAATKSFVNSVAAGLAILAAFAEDEGLRSAVAQLPTSLADALACDWSPLAEGLAGASSFYVLGRGPALAIAHEVALKFKETCGLHAEAYSAAEVLHGPSRLVEAGFPILALTAGDAAEASVLDVVGQLAEQGARCFATAPGDHGGIVLPRPAAVHALADTLALIVCFYGFVEQLSRRLGHDPDRPPHLKKVTETL